MACASCSRPLPDGAKFCPFCGHEVVTTAGEERRLVTVLFADIVGYTGLVEHLDPERVKRLIDDAFERLIADIVEYGGRVDKLLGDGILALFGAPIAHEDDPDRAIRAALKMHVSLAEFVREHEELERSVELRVGVNTGEVLVGRVGGTDDYTAMGDVVNVASRIQTLAPPGEVYIGSSTAALASLEILREVVDELGVRGRQQTETVWRVTGRERRTSNGREPSQLPFIGRAEQRELLSSIMQMVSSGRSAVVAVSGEAGVGKTRLVTEALDASAGDWAVFAGACAPYGETNVWAPISTALFGRVDHDTTISPELLHELSVVKGTQQYGFEADDPVLAWFVEGVAHIGGHPSALDQLPPAQAREMLFRLVIEVLRRRSAEGPVVLWLDDLQWADSLILDLLHRVTRSLVDRPVLLITTRRDDVEVDWPPVTDHPVIIRMPLDPLSRPEAARLVHTVIGGSADPVLARELYERSGGNPLFLTELAGLARQNPDSIELPTSLRVLIAARLDQLPPTARAVIDNAAVLGADSPVDSLRMFAAELRQPFSNADVDALVEAGLIDVTRGWYRFRSDIVREVAYHTLTKLVRAQRHAATASVMLGIPGIPLDRIAHHATTTAELVAEIGDVPGVLPSVADQAIELLQRAGQGALDVGAFNQALRHASRALDLGPDDPAVVRQFLLLRASALTEMRDVKRAGVDAQHVLESAIEAGDRVDEGIARRLLGIHAQIIGDISTARRELGTSVDIFRELGDDAQLATSLADRGFVEVFGGSLADAEWLLGEAESLATQLDDRRAGAWVREHQAWVAFLSGDIALAETRLKTAAAQFEELGDRAGRTWAQALQAYLFFFERRLDEAEALAATVRHEAIELGERWAPAMMDSLVASIRLWAGQFAEAEELSRRSLAAFRELGDRFGVVQALAPRIRSLVALGRSHEAEMGLEEALTLSDSFGDLAFPAMAAAGTTVHLGLGDRAVVISELALARLVAMGANAGEAPITLALALCQVGRAEEGLTTLLDTEISSPYGYAVRALASTMSGVDESAIGDAAEVWANPTSTYLDRVLADVAASAVELGLGERIAATERLARARSTAHNAGDAVARAFAGCASATLVGEVDMHEVDHLGPGWQRVLDGLAERASIPTAP